MTIIYKYNILVRVIVKNIIQRNVIINRVAAEVDNHISRDYFFDFHLSRMKYLFYYTEYHSYIFLPWFGKFQKTTQCIIATTVLRMDEIITLIKGLCLQTV